jgi:integrase
VEPINNGSSGAAVAGSVLVTFAHFVEKVYFPHCRRTWKASTELTTVPAIRRYLLPELGAKLLRSIMRDDMQNLLESKATALSKSVLHHMRWDLNAIFKLAVSDGVMGNNPAAELRVPRNCKPGREVRPLSAGEVLQYLGVLDLPARLMARLAIYEGFRPGEILALRWGSLENDLARVIERVYWGQFDAPKNGKSRESALSDGTLADLKLWGRVAQSTDAEAFVFASENPASPLSMRNFWPRAFKARLEKIGLAWATFQVLRKTNASLSAKAGVTPKVSADQRGHGLGVSMEVYTISDHQQKRKAVKQLESMIGRARKAQKSA